MTLKMETKKPTRSTRMTLSIKSESLQEEEKKLRKKTELEVIRRELQEQRDKAQDFVRYAFF